MNDQVLSCVALTLVPGLGTRRLHRLLQHWGSPAKLLNLSAGELARLNLSSEAQAFISSSSALKAAEESVGQAKQKGINILSIFDPEYPHFLKQIFDPPLVLYYRGDPAVLCNPSVAVVGSRRSSLYGREVTQRIARKVAAMGLSVVSGLARGIDSQAHIGALEGGGKTVAVLGNGVDVVYPSENGRLSRRICENGCLVSEFRCGTFPVPQNFPLRNRIISGLCHGTLITEASEFSGSLITARLTLEQNRQVWAVPGNITSPGSYGPNHLIKQGARIVLDTQDILEELPPYVLDLLCREEEETPPATKASLTRDERAVLKVLAPDAPVQFDRILRCVSMPLSELNEILLQLEMKGIVRQWPGRSFSRKSHELLGF